MSLHILATGTLIADPVSRTSQKGNAYVTASVRVATEDDSILVSAIAFGDQAAEMLSHQAGHGVAIWGGARLPQGPGGEGEPKQGISVRGEKIAGGAAARRADAKRRQREVAA